jgi:Transcriptional regulator, AbiEi antitoxin
MMIKVTPTVSFMRSRLSSTLYGLAARHGGYFTTREAAQAGLSSRQLSYHASSGELERVAHGGYRLVNYPEHAHGDMIVATLRINAGCTLSAAATVGVTGQMAAPLLRCDRSGEDTVRSATRWRPAIAGRSWPRQARHSTHPGHRSQ